MAATIMLVDDNPICNLIMKKVLTRIPVDTETHEFTDPVRAFSQLSSLNPDLIFLDLNMPVLDGWGFLEQMKERNQTHRVIILTSSTSRLDQDRCQDFPNVLAYYNKPLTQNLINSLLHIFQTELSDC